MIIIDEEAAEAWDTERASPIGKVLKDINKSMANEMSRLMPEINQLISSGVDAKEFAKKARGIAQYKMLKDLLSDDERLAQAAAEKIMDRSDGKVTGDQADKSITVNVLNASSDDDREMLKRKLVFLEEIMKNKDEEGEKHKT